MKTDAVWNGPSALCIHLYFFLYFWKKIQLIQEKYSTFAGVLPLAGGEDPSSFSSAFLWLATISRSTCSPSAALNTGREFKLSITARLPGQRAVGWGDAAQREAAEWLTDRQYLWSAWMFLSVFPCTSEKSWWMLWTLSWSLIPSRDRRWGLTELSMEVTIRTSCSRLSTCSSRLGNSQCSSCKFEEFEVSRNRPLRSMPCPPSSSSPPPLGRFAQKEATANLLLPSNKQLFPPNHQTSYLFSLHLRLSSSWLQVPTFSSFYWHIHCSTHVSLTSLTSSSKWLWGRLHWLASVLHSSPW